jgi:hypothetical protein
MMKLLLMKVKVVEVKSKSATSKLFIDSTIIKIYLYLYFILIFHPQDVAAYVFCKKITDINGQFSFFECLDFDGFHCTMSNFDLQFRLLFQHSCNQCAFTKFFVKNNILFMS